MNVLGICGKHCDAAAALAVDGELVAAATEESLTRVPRVGYRATGGFPFAAARACLDRAGLGHEDVTTVVVAGHQVRDRPEPHRPGRAMRLAGSFPDQERHAGLASVLRARLLIEVSSLRAQAAQVAASANDECTLAIVLDVDSPARGAVFLARGATIDLVRPVPGLERLSCAARFIAECLGCDTAYPYRALEQVGAKGQPEFVEDFAGAIEWHVEAGVRVDEERLRKLVDRASADRPGALADAATPNIEVQERRRSVAASFHRRVTELACEIIDDFCAATDVRAIGLAGSLFSSSDINSRLCERFGDGVLIAPVPEAAGGAIGAALLGHLSDGAPRLGGLTLGPAFSESQIKATLDSCRLDYVYEPSWERLLTRVSAMLARGKLIGWFQGAMEFGSRSLGGRSVLGDPSSQYTRENINRFFKQRPTDHPLAVSLPETAATECLTRAVRSPFMLRQAAVKEEWRDRFRAAIDHRLECAVHTVTAQQAPQLWDLLEMHRQRTGVPGLINTTLSGHGEPTACHPRDAIRTTFSSAVDALVMGRFLVMKDYWLLRSEVD